MKLTRVTFSGSKLIQPKDGDPEGFEVYQNQSFGSGANSYRLYLKGTPVSGEGPGYCLDGSRYCRGKQKPLDAPLDSGEIKTMKPLIPYHLAGLLARIYGLGWGHLNGELVLYSTLQSPNPQEYLIAWEFVDDSGFWIAIIDARNAAPIWISDGIATTISPTP